MESVKKNDGIVNDFKLNSDIKKNKYILMKHRSSGQQELKPFQSMIKFNMAVLVWM